MNIANLTTILRIVLIPVIVGYYYSNLAQGT